MFDWFNESDDKLLVEITLCVLGVVIIIFALFAPSGLLHPVENATCNLSEGVIFKSNNDMDGWALRSSEPVIEYNPDDVRITIDDRGITIQFTDEYEEKQTGKK